MNVIREFQNQHRFLSNFWLVVIDFEGHLYISTEHAYQAAKTLDPVIRQQVRNVTHPGQVKKFARTIPLRSDWNVVKLGIMEQLQRLKYQNPELKKLLLSTYPDKIEEGNNWRDTFWGIDLKSGIGQNHLGKILMKIREELLPSGSCRCGSSKYRIHQPHSHVGWTPDE